MIKIVIIIMYSSISVCTSLIHLIYLMILMMILITGYKLSPAIGRGPKLHIFILSQMILKEKLKYLAISRDLFHERFQTSSK